MLFHWDFKCVGFKTGWDYSVNWKWVESKYHFFNGNMKFVFQEDEDNNVAPENNNAEKFEFSAAKAPTDKFSF